MGSPFWLNYKNSLAWQGVEIRQVGNDSPNHHSSDVTVRSLYYDYNPSKLSTRSVTLLRRQTHRKVFDPQKRDAFWVWHWTLSLSLSLFWVPQIGGVDAKNGPISRSIFGRTKIDPTTQEASKFFLSIKTSKTSEDWKKMFNKKETCASVIKHGNWKLLINGACNGKITYKYLWMDVPLSIG